MSGGRALDDGQSLVDPAERDLDVAQARVEAIRAGVDVDAEAATNRTAALSGAIRVNTVHEPGRRHGPSSAPATPTDGRGTGTFVPTAAA